MVQADCSSPFSQRAWTAFFTYLLAKYLGGLEVSRGSQALSSVGRCGLFRGAGLQYYGARPRLLVRHVGRVFGWGLYAGYRLHR